MKIYGKDGKEYQSVDLCVKADKEFDELLAKTKADLENKEKKRKARAEEVNEAYRVYQDLLNSFIKDYGTYHTRITATDMFPFDIFQSLLSL